MEFRFAVGSPGGRKSDSWKLWSDSKGEIYLTQRGRSCTNKFSFHQSGDPKHAYRWASIRPLVGGVDPAFKKWNRDMLPAAGVSRLLAVIFPTNHLSSAWADPRRKDKLCWFDPAPAGEARVVEFFLTKDDRPTVENGLAVSERRTVVRYTPLPNHRSLVVATYTYACGPQELRIPLEPRVPGQVFGELFFPDNTHQDQGRPIRLLGPLLDADQRVVWEFGGYEVQKLSEAS
jgi:hypothetical protein